MTLRTPIECHAKRQPDAARATRNDANSSLRGHARSTISLVAFALASAACGARSELRVVAVTSAVPDAALDAPVDSAVDATADSRTDSGIAQDAPTDAPRCPIDFAATIPAQIRATADDELRIFVNASLVDATPRAWNNIGTFAIRLFRHPARANVLALEGINRFRISGRDRGVIAVIDANTEQGQARLVTDSRFRIAAVALPNWTSVDFDDRGLPRAIVEGADGIAPWGTLLNVPTAQWLWLYDSNLPESEKRIEERVFLRRTFFIDRAGQIVDTPTPCP